jgi:iron(III) transport system substrate-binding protein
MLSENLPTRRQVLLGASALAGLSIVAKGAAFAAPAAQWVEAARAEGALTWYSGYTPPQNAALAAGFKKLYGVDVNVVRVFGAQFMSRYSAEQAAGAVEGDVIMQADQLIVREAAAKGWLQTFTKAELPALEQWPQDSWFENAFAALIYVPLSLAVNTNKVADADWPKKWEDILKPEFRGQILLPDPRLTFSNLPNIMFFSQTYGDSFVEALGKQEIAVSTGVVPGLQQLAAGEKSVLINTVPGGDSELVKNGAPIKTIIPEQYSGFAHYAGVSAKSSRPNAARLFLNFLMSQEGQEILTNGTGFSPLGEIPGSLHGERFKLIDWNELAANRDRFIKLLGL